MKTLLAVLALALCLAAPAPASVTDRYFRDQHLVSPDARLKLDAVSPDNAGDRPQPFADDFTYTLTDVASGRVLWQRRQPTEEGSPMRVFLDDAGYVVVYASGEDLVVLDASTGRKLLELSLIAAFGEEECDAYVSWSTAGPSWWGTSHAYFLTHRDAQHFVLRTWWDKRIIIDLAAGRVLQGPSRALSEACRTAEARWALDALAEAAAMVDTLEAAEWQVRWRAHTAVDLVGRLGLAEAADDLRLVERSDSSDSSSVLGWGQEHETNAAVDVRSFTEVGLRQRAQLALRRLGQVPSGLGCVWFASTTGDAYYTPEVHQTPRVERVDQVVPGLTPRQVLDTIGCPDYVIHYRSQWEYDMDGADPCTLVLTLDKQWGRVEEVQQIRPPRWKSGFERDQMLNW